MLSLVRSISAFLMVLLLTFAFVDSAQAAKKRGGKGAFAGGSLSMGLGISLTTAEHTGINSLINAAKANNNSTASSLSGASEYIGYITFHFANNFVAIQLRPTLFSQSTSGSGTDGSHSYELSGYSVFHSLELLH